MSSTHDWSQWQELPAPDNELDRELLRGDPRALILRYQPMLIVIVKECVKRRMFSEEDVDDAIQSLNEHLLVRLDALRGQFTGAASVSTYLSAIIHNGCASLARRRAQERGGMLLSEPVADPLPEPDSADTLKREIRRFRGILSISIARRPRMVLCLKGYYRLLIPVGQVEILYPGKELPGAILMQYNQQREEVPDRELYRLLAALLNSLEGKNNTPDALRKWTQARLEEVILLMNAGFPGARYDKESLEALVEDFFSPFLEREASI